MDSVIKMGGFRTVARALVGIVVAEWLEFGNEESNEMLHVSLLLTSTCCLAECNFLGLVLFFRGTFLSKFDHQPSGPHPNSDDPTVNKVS